jgi:MFS family permease
MAESQPTGSSSGAATETWLDRIGIPRSLLWGFVGVLIFMTGNGTESNFISPHIAKAIGSENTAALIITLYGATVIVGSYLAGSLGDLFGPRRIMALGFAVWVVFEAAFLASLRVDNTWLVLISYTLRGFGYPLFAFAFLVWVTAVAPYRRTGAAVGWFYVMFTGGLPTLGSVWALIFIPIFGGGYTGETQTMMSSTALVLAGFLLVWFACRQPKGFGRLAPGDERASKVILDGLRLTVAEPKVLLGFLVRIINTSPEFGMFIVLPTVIADQLGYGQSRWLAMTTAVYAGNIIVNAVFGAVGDRWGWVRTVRWFGVAGSAVGLLAWWYVPHVLPHSPTSFVISVCAGVLFGVLLAGFVPMGAIMANLIPGRSGPAMAMYTTAAGGAALTGPAVVAAVRPFFGGVGVVWAFVVLYAAAFVMTFFLKLPREAGQQTAEETAAR